MNEINENGAEYKMISRYTLVGSIVSITFWLNKSSLPYLKDEQEQY